jgi:Zn-dependent protease
MSMNDRRVYYSFYDIPQSEEDFRQQRRGISFSQTELLHIGIAMAVLTVAFAFAFAPNPPLSHLSQVFENLPLSFLAIGTAFFCHEMAHKYMGQRYGYWSEFRMYPQGLVFALLLGIAVGVVFAAPGAVQIYGRPNKEENGRISVAGPAINVIIAAVFLLLGSFTGGIVAAAATFIAAINAFLALFNLLPFGPLDGRKVFQWQIEIWGGLLAAAMVLLVVSWAALSG